MRKRHLAALVAAAALATSGAAWADTASQPMTYNTSGDPANDAISNQITNVGGNGTSNGGSNGSTNGDTNGVINGGTNGASNGDSNGDSNGRTWRDALGGMFNGSWGGTNGGTNGGYNGGTNGGTSGGTNGGTNGGTGYGGSNGDTDNGGDNGLDILKHGTGVSHLALLAGGNEVSKDGKASAGDEDGKGAASLSLDPEAGTLCFGLVVNNIDGPVAAHIHRGKAGHNGPVVVPLKAPDAGNPGAVSGCIHHVDRALLHAIHAHPWAYYVNIHTSAYPEGAIRGQIF